MAKHTPTKQERQETWVPSLGWEHPLEEGVTTPSGILDWESHGQRSLVGDSPWGRVAKSRSDTTDD